MIGISDKLLNSFLKSLDKIKYGSFELELANGKKYHYSGKLNGPEANLRLHEPAVLLNMLFKGDIGLADDYRKGLWDSKNLESLFHFGLMNDHAFNNYINGSFLWKIGAKLSYLFTKNTRAGSKKNIHAHYDLGNDFYKLWLDPTMTYSSAIFNQKEEDLSQAQDNKYDRILNLIGNTPKKVIEIGCGWGGFADRCLSKSEHQVEGVTLSKEQLDYAKERLRNKLPSDSLKLKDYRDISGKFDRIVSIEMFEAVGEEYWKTFFKKIKSILNDNGKALIQTITIKDELFESYRKSGDAIRSYIFPGGMLPSPSRFKQEAELAGLKINDQFFFGQDYAQTLRLWLNSFDDKIEDIKKLNFDDSFIRLWRFYLASCISAFATDRTNVMQVELIHD